MVAFLCLTEGPEDLCHIYKREERESGGGGVFVERKGEWTEGGLGGERIRFADLLQLNIWQWKPHYHFVVVV